MSRFALQVKAGCWVEIYSHQTATNQAHRMRPMSVHPRLLPAKMVLRQTGGRSEACGVAHSGWLARGHAVVAMAASSRRSLAQLRHISSDISTKCTPPSKNSSHFDFVTL